MVRLIAAAAILFLCAIDWAQAQYWQRMPSGYLAWGTYREWPRGFYGFTPGYRYYGPGYFRPFSYWERNPRYRY
jgi:hypothetical protein